MHFKINYILVVLTAFLLPIGQWLPVIVLLMFLNWLLEGNFKSKFSGIKNKQLFTLFCSFYLLHLLGMLYTANSSSGWFDMEVKLSLLLFPVLLATINIDKQEIESILKWFVAGCIAMSCICLFSAAYVYMANHENHFFYELFSLWQHPSYLSMYLNMAICILIHYLFHANAAAQKKQDAMIVSLILFFSFIIFLLSSKMGIITMVLIYVVAFLHHIIKTKKIVFGVAGLLTIAVIVFISIQYIPEVGARLDRAMKAMTETTIDKTSAESSAVRILIWKTDVDIIQEHLLAGVGTGDVKDVLLEKYKSKGMTGAYKTDEKTGEVIHVLNSHNQFLQTFIALGLAGFIMLLLCLLLPLLQAYKQGNYLLIAFLMIAMLNFLTESMLEREAGVMFYAFLGALLVFQPNEFKSEI